MTNNGGFMFTVMMVMPYRLSQRIATAERSSGDRISAAPNGEKRAGVCRPSGFKSPYLAEQSNDPALRHLARSRRHRLDRRRFPPAHPELLLPFQHSLQYQQPESAN